MKVATWYNNEDIRIEEVPKPAPGPREMLVKVQSCGICGSDVVEWYRLPRAPLVLGHEMGAEVVEVGSSLDRFKPGDRVFIAPKVPCMECETCLKGHHPVCSAVKVRMPGAFAEYVLVPEVIVEKGTYPLPGSMTYDQSTFIEPLACVVRAQRLADLQEKRTVMIVGCGMSGLLHIKLAKTKECRIIAADINPKRLEFARRFGADITVAAQENICEIIEAEKREKPDIIILCTGAPPAVEQAWQCLEKGGAIVFFAVPGPDQKVTVPINDFWTKEIRILTSYYCGPSDIRKAMELIEKKIIRVDDMITHTLPLQDILRGFQLVTAGKESIKVIIKPHA